MNLISDIISMILKGNFCMTLNLISDIIYTSTASLRPVEHPPGGPEVKFLSLDTFQNDIGQMIPHINFDQNWMKNVRGVGF